MPVHILKVEDTFLSRVWWIHLTRCLYCRFLIVTEYLYLTGNIFAKS